MRDNNDNDEIDFSDVLLEPTFPVLGCDSFWNEDKTIWKQPPVKVKHGDLVNVELDVKEILKGEYLGRYIGKGMGVVEFYNYSSGVSQYVGYAVGRGLDLNPRLISDEELFKLIED